MSDRAAIVRRFYAAYADNDRTTAESLVAPGFTFTSPRDAGLDRDAYFERCWPNDGKITDIRIERLFVEGDAAFVVYKATDGAGSTFRNAEVLTFDGGLVAGAEVYFGPGARG